MSTIIFIDTEFTDFKNMDLISIGAVSEDGQHEFYVELMDHIGEYRSDFVNQVVVPLLDYPNCGKNSGAAALDLVQWLNSLPSDDIEVVVDYGGDWLLMCNLLEQGKKHIPLNKRLHCKFIGHAMIHTLQMRGYHMPSDITKAQAALMNETPKYYEFDGRVHHALVDAKANRHGWVAALKAVG